MKWRRLLASLRSRTSALVIIFCITSIVYFKAGNQSISSRKRDYSQDIYIPQDYAFQQVFSKKVNPTGDSLACVLVICASRPSAVKNHLAQLIKYRPSPKLFPIVVSQDGQNSAVTGFIAKHLNETENIYHQKHPQVGKGNYQNIAMHYKWALDKVFNERNFTHVIITEEDLDIAPDFFSYFEATRQLLVNDKSLWCVSAWNDNGGVKLTDRNRSELLWRTDFFPGLGWMLSKELWTELSPIFPSIYWDDWMRRPDVRKNRACIRPEVGRTSHNMAVAGKGSSKGLYRKYLEAITLPTDPVDFTNLDLSYLNKENYDKMMRQNLLEAKLIDRSALLAGDLDPQNAYRVSFENARHFTDVAMKYEMMYDMRSGVPRTAYSGLITFLANGARIYFLSNRVEVKEFGLQTHEEAYDLTWEHQARYLEFSRMYCKTKWKGKCDPEDPEMAKWIKRRRIKLENWGKMVVV